MARKHRNDPRPGDDDFIPLTATERRTHADVLTHAHEGRQCAERAEALCQAIRWFTAGLVEQLGHLTDLDLDLDDLRYDFDLANLARGRYQARQALDMPPDHIDVLVQEIHQIKTTSARIH